MSSADLPNGLPQDQTNPAANAGANAPVQPPKKKKRRWLRYIVALIVVLVLLVGLAPTLLSTGPGKSAVLGVANKYLNGKVEVANWSLGWLSGIRADGIKIFDDKNLLILEVGSFKTDMSITDAARGKYDLGDTQVKGLNLAHVQIDENGAINYEKLLKTDPAAPRAPKTSDRAAGPTELPNVSGTVTVEYSGKVEAAGVPDVVTIRPGIATLKIPSINDPITNSITLELQVGDAAPGTITLEGTSAIAKNNKLTLESANIDQNVTIKSLNLATLQQIARTLGIDLQAAGVANGILQLKTAGVQNASLVGTINASSVAIKSPYMRGDTYSSANVSIPIKLNVWKSADNLALKIEQLDINADQCFVQVKADTSLAALKAAALAIPEALKSALTGQAPAQVAIDTGEGWVTITAGADIKALADQLPHVFALQPGAKVDSGKLSSSLRLNLAKTDAPISSTTRIEIAGRNNGRPVTLKPIEVKFEANLIGLRDIGVDVSSGFLTVTGGGKTLKKTDLNGKFDLAQISAELDPLINVAQLINGVGGKPITMAGSGEFAIGTDGDPTSPDSLINATVTSTIRSINISGIKELPALQQEFTRLTASAQVAKKDLTTIQKASVALTSGSENAPFLDLMVGVNGLNLTTYACGFALQKMNVTDLARVQREFGALVPVLAQKGIVIGEGQLSATVSGTYDGRIIKTSQPFTLSAPSVTIASTDVHGKSVPLLTKEQLDVSVAGVVDTTPKNFSADIAELLVSTQSNILQISKGKDAPFKISQTANGGIGGQGSVRIVSDAKRVSDLAQAFGGQTTSANMLKSGLLDATITLNSDAEKGGSVELAGTIDKLTIATAQQPIENQKVTFKLAGASPKGFGSVAFSGNVNSSFVNATITNGSVRIVPDMLMFSGRPIEAALMALQILDSATIDVTTDNLPGLQALANSFSVPVTIEPIASGTPAAGPIQVTSGNANAKLVVLREGKTVTVSSQGIRVGSLALRRDGREFAFDQQSPITIAMSASLDESGGAAIKVSQFKVSVPRLAQVALTEPLTVTASNFSAANSQPKTSASGAIQATTSIEAVAPLLAMLQGGEPLPYRGNLVVTQKISSSGGPIALTGDTSIDQFKVMNGREVAFAEEKLTVVNDIDVDLEKSNLVVRNVEVNAPQSQAISAKLTGQVFDFLKSRTIKGLGNEPTMTLVMSPKWDKLWSIVYPMLTPDQQASYKDIKPAGNETMTFHVAGMYPAVDGRGRVVPFNVSVKYLTVDGALPVASLETGVSETVTGINIPVTLKDGIFTISPKMQPAKIGKGELQLAGINADLSQPTIRVSAPPKLTLLKNVSINPALGDKIGKFINPVLTNTTRASGLLTVTVDKLDKVALGDEMKTANSGSAEIAIDLDQMDIANPLGGAIVGGLGAFGKNVGSDTNAFRGQIRHGLIKLDNGVTTQNITMEIIDPGADVKPGEKPPVYAWNFTGDVRLSDFRQKLMLTLPTNMVAKLFKADDLMKFLPGGIPVAMTGTTLKPDLDFGVALKSIAEAQLKAGLLGKSGLGKVLGGDNATTQPGEKSDPLGDLLKGLGGDKKKEDPAPPKRRPRG